MPLSTTPVLVGPLLEPRHLVLRTYLAAREDSFVVMPGGLARVSASRDTMVVSMQLGGGSKDAWVLSPGPVNPFSLLRAEGQPLELTQGGNDLPSRMADNLFWLGRYVERAEGMTRLLRGILVRLTERPGLAEVPELPAQFAFDSRYICAGADLAGYALPSFSPGRRLLEAILELTHRIHHDFLYDARATTVSTPPQEVLAKRRGVCQDFAHLEIACLRLLGLAARYVSGYLGTDTPPGERQLLGADATHAWLGVFCPEWGWVDVDPTNDQVPSGRHVVLTWGRDYDDVSPIKGVILGGEGHGLQVAVDVVATGADTHEQTSG